MLISDVLKQIETNVAVQIVPIKGGMLNVKCTTSNHPKRFNVLGDINLNSGRFNVYDTATRKWVNHKILGLNTVEQVVSHIKNDIEKLSSWINEH
jgi:uncharacterized membrane protein